MIYDKPMGTVDGGLAIYTASKLALGKPVVDNCQTEADYYKKVTNDVMRFAADDSITEFKMIKERYVEMMEDLKKSNQNSWNEISYRQAFLTTASAIVFPSIAHLIH
jgi:hypothetical protein